MKRLTLLVHGESGVGKSWLGVTAPGPRLYIDVEGRSEYLPNAQYNVYWDPRQPLPVAYPDGTPIHTETNVVITVRDYPTFEQVKSWLQAGQHYFKSVIIDSLSELQQRCLDSITGAEQARTQDWGTLLRKVEGTVREYRDLRTHPFAPIDALVIVSGTHMKDGLFRPLLQGGLSTRLAYHFDAVGFLQFTWNGQEMVRSMAIQPYGQFVAKDNTDLLTRAYGMNIHHPHVGQIIAVLNQEVPA